MKDLLAPDQRKKVEGIRADIAYQEKALPDYMVMEKCALELLAILDSLQPKKYTEEEVRAGFEKRAMHIELNVEKMVHGGYLNDLTWKLFQEWKACARFLGVIEEEKP